MKNSFICRTWQSVYIRLVLTLIRTNFWPRSAFMCFCAFSKVTAAFSIYILPPLVFLTETQCPLRGTNWGYICICRLLLVLEISAAICHAVICQLSCLGLGKIAVGTGFCASAAVLGFQYHSEFIRKILKSKWYSFIFLSKIPSFCN